MSNDLMLQGKANLPAHARAEGNSNLAGDLLGAGFNKLTFKGSRFRVKIGGEERVLGGTELPVVILDANPHVSRIYYGSKWDGETASRPECGSEDGITPLSSVAEPQAKTCAACPQNEKGSAITDTGGKTKACSYYKRVVLLLVNEPELGPLVADMKAMSMFGNSYADKGLFSLRDYAKRLDTNTVASYAVVTSLEFDTEASVPKVLFRATDYTSEGFHTEHVEPLLQSGELEVLVRTNDVNTAGEDDVKPAENTGFRDKLMGGDEEEAPKHAKKSESKAEDLEEDDDEEEELTPAQKAAITRKKNAKKKAKKEAKAAKEAQEAADAKEDEDIEGDFDSELEDALAEFDFDD